MRYVWVKGSEARVMRFERQSGYQFYDLLYIDDKTTIYKGSVEIMNDTQYRAHGPMTTKHNKDFDNLEDAQAYLLGVARFT